MAPIQIREFRYPGDYAAAIALWDSMKEGVHVGGSDSPAEIQKKLLRDPDLFLVAQDGAELIGTVIGGFDGRRGFVYHLAVAASHRRIGVATQLMEEVESRLRRKGCVRCYLLVHPDNEAAIRHYEKRGWTLMNDLPYAKDLA